MADLERQFLEPALPIQNLRVEEILMVIVQRLAFEIFVHKTVSGGLAAPNPALTVIALSASILAPGSVPSVA